MSMEVFVPMPEVGRYLENDETIWEQAPLQRLAEDGELRAFVTKASSSQWIRSAIAATWSKSGHRWVARRGSAGDNGLLARPTRPHHGEQTGFKGRMAGLLVG